MEDDPDPFKLLVTGELAEHPMIAKFREGKAPHHYWEKSAKTVAYRLLYAPQDEMTAVIGPTASGKTALSNEICRRVERAAEQFGQNRPPRIVRINLRSPASGRFDWSKDFFKPVNNAFSLVPHEKKISLDAVRRPPIKGPRGGTPRQSADEAEDEMHEHLSAQNVIGVLVDNAQHIRKAASGKAAADNYDKLKCTSDNTRSHFVLFATSHLKDLLAYNGEVGRRVLYVPFHGYSYDETGLERFAQAAVWLAEHAPLPIAFSLDDRLQEIFVGSLGEIGALYAWFERALGHVIIRAGRKISWDDMLSTALTKIQRSGIEREAVDLKSFIVELEKAKAKEEENRPPTKGKRRPGVPNPRRLPLGGDLDTAG